MRWTWDTEKNRENIRKHGIDFPTALLIFNDLNSATREDDYEYEQRWQTIGMVGGRLVVVIYTWPEREDDYGRIISARKPTPSERRRHEEGRWSN